MWLDSSTGRLFSDRLIKVQDGFLGQKSDSAPLWDDTIDEGWREEGNEDDMCYLHKQ